jgi:hypothetical protein
MNDTGKVNNYVTSLLAEYKMKQLFAMLAPAFLTAVSYLKMWSSIIRSGRALLKIPNK